MLLHALLPRQSGTVHGFSREFHEDCVPHVQRCSLIRTRSRACGGIPQPLQPDGGTTSVNWPTTRLRRGADPTTCITSQVLRHRFNQGLESHPPPFMVVISLRNSSSPFASSSLIATTTRQLLAFILPRITWHCHSWCSARQMPLKFRTTVPHPKAVFMHQAKH